MDILELLIRENPKLHYVSEETAKFVTDKYGVPFPSGFTSWAVAPHVLRALAGYVKSDQLTIETGSGHTTVLLAALARHHICITTDAPCVEQIRKYMAKIGVGSDKVTFLVESSDTALPKLVTEKLDLAFIDGAHGYPFPALDWHYIDPHLKEGGIIGFDNTEIRAVHEQCVFLEDNKTYELIEDLYNNDWNYGAKFYRKLKDQVPEALFQLYNNRRVNKPPFLKSLINPKPKVWPWD